MPAKIRNSVPEKYQAKPMKIAKLTVAMPPTVIAQVRSLRVGALLSALKVNPFRQSMIHCFFKRSGDQDISRAV
jgi:hypothetical protein